MALLLLAAPPMPKHATDNHHLPLRKVVIPDRRYFEKLICCREGCPVNTDARGYVQAVAQGDYETAYRIARGPNPFASICGRVCGAPCETACRRGMVDEPVNIRAIKRTTTERHGVEVNENLRETLEMAVGPGSLDPRPRPEKVAIVGAGVAGMSCAHDLARLGYQVTVFEATEEPGGMLRFGVPIFRLPREVWQREIDAILELGVELRCGVKIGEDMTIAELREQDFEAVLVAVGLQKSRLLELPGHEMEGILGGLQLLADFNARREIPPLGRTVVIGGGNVAYDCARSAVRLESTTSVHLVCLEALSEMPADEIEIIEGDEEGIVRMNRRGPVRFVGDGKKITGLEVRLVSRVFDEQGRFSPKMENGTEEVIDCDTIVLAIGQAGDESFVTGVQEIELGRGGTVVADRESGRTSIPWLFAAGDIAMGPGLFIDCVAQGRRAARSIHEHIAGQQEADRDYAPFLDRAWIREGIRDNLRRSWMDLPRTFPPAEDPRTRFDALDRQVEHVFPDAQARDEGARCLRCEVETIFDGNECILCGGCADVCPTYCLRLVSLAEIGMETEETAGMSAIIKDEDRCIRCAMCAIRCPTDAITMERLCGYEPWADRAALSTAPGEGTG